MAFLTPDNLPWVSIYWIFAFISLLMMAIVLTVRFPKVVRKEDEIVGAWETHVELFKQKLLFFFFLGYSPMWDWTGNCKLDL